MNINSKYKQEYKQQIGLNLFRGDEIPSSPTESPFFCSVDFVARPTIVLVLLSDF